MPAARVNVAEIDLSQRIPSFPGVYVAMLLNGVMGPSEPMLVTTMTGLLVNFTPYEKILPGYSATYRAAEAALQRNNKVWIKNVMGEGATFGGVTIFPETDSNANKNWSTGFATEAGIQGATGAFETDFTAQMALYQVNPGVWSDAFGVEINVYRASETRTNVDIEGGITEIETIDLDTGTPVNSDTDKITVADENDYEDDLKVVLVGTDLPDGLAEDTVYYVIKNDDGTISLSDTEGGAAVDLLDTGSGSMVIYDATSYIVINTGANSLALSGAWEDGHRVNILGTTVPAGLTADTTRFLHDLGDGTYTVHTTRADALAGTDEDTITDAGDGSLQVRDAEKVDLLDNTLGLDQNWVTGESVRVRTKDGGTVPAGLTANTTYYLVEHTDGNDSTNRFKVATTQANAIAGSPVTVTITGAGSGSWVVEPIRKVAEPYTFEIKVHRKETNGETTLLETHLVSRDPAFRNAANRPINVEFVLKSSKYIRGYQNPVVLGAETITYPDSPPVYPKPTAGTAGNILYFDGGADGSAVTETEMVAALNDYTNSDDYPITCLIDAGWHGGAAGALLQNALVNVAEGRDDCVAFLSVPLSVQDGSDYLTNIIDWRNDNLSSSSYGAVYVPHLVVEDTVNGAEIITDPTGFVASAFGQVAFNLEAWFPIAGNSRGKIVGPSRTYVKFTDGDADALYDAGINPIRQRTGRGITIWGQKTLLGTPSSLDRLNVRCMLVVIKPAIKAAMEDHLFDFNTPERRDIAKRKLETYLERVQTNEGVTDYQVIADETNNTADDVENLRMNLDVYVKPPYATEEINVRVILTRAGLSFQDAQNVLAA